MNTLEVSGNWGEVLKWYIPVYLKFRALQIAFYVHYTTREICIKLTTLVCGWCQAILENQTVKNESYYSAFETQWKHPYLTFWFAGNDLAPTKYCHFNAFLMHNVRGEKYNLQCPKLKLHKIIYGDLSFSIFCIKFSTASRVYITTL